MPGRPLSVAILVSALLTAGPAAAEEAAADDRAVSRPADIIVTARLDDRAPRDLKAPMPGVRIGADQIAAVNAVNTEDVVRYAPALIVRKRYIGDANATLSFRNMHTTQTPRALVTVDGFTISDFLGADFTTAPKWAVLAPDDIAGAEIIYGPTSARYSGHSMGGAMRIQTRAVTETAARATLQLFGQDYRYYATDEKLFGWSADAGADFALAGGGGIAVSYRHFENESQPQEWRMVSVASPYGGQGIVDARLPFLRIGAQDSTVETAEDQLRLRARSDLGGGWDAHAMAALLVKREATLHPKSFLKDADRAESFVGISGVNVGIARSAQLMTGAGLSGDVAGWRLDLCASRFDMLSNRERRSDNFDVVTGARPRTGRLTVKDAHWTSVEGVAERRSGAHVVALGFSYAGYVDDNRTYVASDWRRAELTGLRDASGGRTRLLGAFVEDEVTLAPWLTATLGLRYEHWRASGGFLTDGGVTVRYAGRGADAWSPKAALRFRPDALTEIIASAALATRFPTVRELYQAGLIAYGPEVGRLDLNGFNPDLAPEKAVDLQLAVSRRIGGVKLMLSGYRQSVRDTIFSQTIAIPASGTGDLVQSSLMTNIGKVRSRGADVTLSADRVLIDGLAFDANLSWIDARIGRNPLNPALEGHHFPRVPKWRANASLRYSPDANWSLAANFRHQSMPHRNIENSSTSLCDSFYCVSPFAFVDLKAARRFGTFELSAGIDNLLNEKAFVYHPYPGRSFVLNLTWDGRRR